ncbi:integral membrane protein [Daldinia loculata]|nr:integral membrane protein [Daldinia loculata]
MEFSSLGSVDLSENRQPDLYAAITVCLFFALVSVALRFWCRWINQASFGLDDWLILFALASSFGLAVGQLWWIPRGLGRHVQTFGPNVVETFYICLFISEMTYTGAIVFVKFSILALYWRIFNKSGSIKLPITILTAAVLMWGLAVLFLTLLQCIPTRGIWDKTIEASCNVDSQKFLFAISIPNILVDVTILILPIPYVMHLNVTKSQKRAVITLFLLGGFVCVASIMRLVAVIIQKDDADISWNIVNQSIWATVEANFAIISGCLPTLRPVWIAIRKKSSHTEQSRSSYQHAAGTTPPRRRPSSWATLILGSKANSEEDSLPFSAIHGPTEDPSRPGTVQELQMSSIATSIPLPDIPTRMIQSPDTIRIENTWDVEYSQEVQPENHA